MDKRGKVEGSKDEVCLPRDIGETRRYGPSQGEVEHPGSGLSHDVCLRGKLLYQFVAVENATALARTRIGKISAG